MKQLFILSAILLPMFLQAQNKVSVNAKIKSMKAGTWVFYGPQSGDKMDSVKTVQGGFSFKVTIPEGGGDVYMIQIGRHAIENSMWLLFLDKDNITITGNGPMFKDVSQSGSQANDDWIAYLHFIENDSVRIKTVSLLDEEQKRFEKTHNPNDIDTNYGPIWAKIDSIDGVLASQWLNEHLTSNISTSVMDGAMGNPGLSDSEKENIMNKLSPEVRNNAPGKRVLHSIEIEKITGIGKQAPEFTQPDTSGKTVSLKDFRNQYVLVDFWASWCRSCREENPNVVKAYNIYKNKNFTILSISLDDKKQNWLTAIHKDHLAWNHVSDLKGWNNAAVQEYYVTGVPSNFLIDPDGKIIAKNLRGDELENKLNEVLKN